MLETDVEDKTGPWHYDPHIKFSLKLEREIFEISTFSLDISAVKGISNADFSSPRLSWRHGITDADILLNTGYCLWDRRTSQSPAIPQFVTLRARFGQPMG